MIVTSADHCINRKRSATPSPGPILKEIACKKLSELTDPTQKAMWVRLYDEVHNPRSYNVYAKQSPDQPGVRFPVWLSRLNPTILGKTASHGTEPNESVMPVTELLFPREYG